MKNIFQENKWDKIQKRKQQAAKLKKQKEEIEVKEKKTEKE